MATRVLGVCNAPDGCSTQVLAQKRVMAAVEQFKIRQHWSPREEARFPTEALHASLQVAEVHPGEIDVVIALTSDLNSASTLSSSVRALGLQRAKLELVDHRIAHA